ncbi:hypothetical protein ACIBEJ_00315 [Nonomuraea sp. NPDC050790]|uniref:hypothetical protein n=1 Tax=Nonomuraea sp. NPDC050790 TaxID=3364371 RepID=UPI00379A7AFD
MNTDAMNTKWFLMADGALVSRSLHVEGAYRIKVTVPAGAVEISAEEAAEIRSGHRESVRAWVMEQNEAAAAIRRRDYDALIGLGAPDATARRLSGYTSPAGDVTDRDVRGR